MSTFPEYLQVTRCTMQEYMPRTIAETHSGVYYVTSRGMHLFRFAVEWQPMSKRYHREASAFFAQLDGLATPFEFVAPGQEPLGTGAGSPVFDGAHTAGDTSIATRGWLKGSKILRKGDLLRIGQKVYRCQKNERANTSGKVTIQIYPGLLQNASDGEGITARGISFRVRMMDVSVPSEMIVAGADGISYEVSATLVEDVR